MSSEWAESHERQKEKATLGKAAFFRSVGPGAVPGGIRTSRFSESRLYVPSGFCNPCHLAGGGFVDVFYDDGRWSKPRSNFFSSYKEFAPPTSLGKRKIKPRKIRAGIWEQLTETKAAHAVDWTSKRPIRSTLESCCGKPPAASTGKKSSGVQHSYGWKSGRQRKASGGGRVRSVPASGVGALFASGARAANGSCSRCTTGLFWCRMRPRSCSGF